MTVDYRQYYLNQAGGQIDPYRSYRYLPNQRGAGFFGRIIKGSLWPIIKSVLPYAKEKALSGVSDLVADLQAGKPFKESGIAALKKTGKQMFSDATRELNFQKGSGVKRRRKASKKPRKARRKPKRKQVKGKKGRKRGGKSKRSVLFP